MEKNLLEKHYIYKYNSPLGEILIASDETSLIGLWFINQKYYAECLQDNYIEKETEVILEAKKWLDIYFKGENPNFTLPIHFLGSKFQLEVWNILYSIPYGKTMTYKEIAEIIAKKRGLKRMSAQAVGNAVSHNHISIIVPCHRVISTNGSLTGYAGGIDKKEELLKLEKII